MTKVRFGIIGFGAFAERAIMPAIRAAKNAELVAIQKRSLDRARWKAQEHGIPLFFDSVEALARSPEVDAVFIVSSNRQHHADTLASAAAKKHVLVEKPMAVSLQQATEMAEACHRNDVQLMVGHMLRFSPMVNRMREIVTGGSIGSIIYAQSHFIYDASKSQRAWLLDPKEAGAGPLFDIGIHCLDTMRYVLGDDRVVSVKSLLQPDRASGEVERTSVLSLGFAGGALGTIFSSYATPYRQTFLEFFGTAGSVSAYQFTTGSSESVLEIKRGEQGLASAVDRETYRIPNLYVMEVEHFAERILSGTAPVIPLESSLHNQEVLEQAVR